MGRTFMGTQLAVKTFLARSKHSIIVGQIAAQTEQADRCGEPDSTVIQDQNIMREARGRKMYINFELGSDRLCGFLVWHSQELGSICVSIRTLPELMIETSPLVCVHSSRQQVCSRLRVPDAR